MRAFPEKRPTSTPDVPQSATSFISEALAKQAALRPPKTPPKIMPVTPTLPRIPKPYKNKNRRRTD
jgi:hypothetical protein